MRTSAIHSSITLISSLVVRGVRIKKKYMIGSHSHTHRRFREMLCHYFKQTRPIQEKKNRAQTTALGNSTKKSWRSVSWIKRATGTLDLRADQQLSKADVVGAWWCSLRQHNWAQAFFSFSIKMLFSFQLRFRNIIFSKLPNPALKRSEWKLSRNLKISFSWLIVISFL